VGPILISNWDCSKEISAAATQQVNGRLSSFPNNAQTWTSVDQFKQFIEKYSRVIGELIASVARQKTGLPDTRVPDQNDLEQKVIAS